MAKLPTKKDLKKLCREKGFDALAWYAWRNALRTFPILGSIPSQKTGWGCLDDTRNCNICCINDGIFTICRFFILIRIFIEEKFELDEAFAFDTVMLPAAAKYQSFSMIARSIEYFWHGARNKASGSGFVKSIAESVSYGINAYSDNACLDVITQNVVADYQQLLRMKESESIWQSTLPLWVNSDSSLIDNEPPQIKQYRQVLDYDLRQMGFDFLADDLSCLFEGKPLGLHAQNYIELPGWNKYSSIERSDPAVLRCLISGKAEVTYIHAVRVLLLGPGGAGKSSLADRLQGKPISQAKKLTVGVDYLNHQPLNLYKNFFYLQQGVKPLNLYLWDFGGQTIFHGLHSAFLHENCVYVLVVDSRHEQAPDEWLNQIRHLAGSRVKVLLVTNWYEACETRQNETRLLREFPNLLDNHSFFYFSCHEPEAVGFQTFVEALEEACLASQRMVLKETLAVNEALQERYQNDVFLEAVDLDKVIEQVTQRAEAVETLPNKLEQLGFLVQVDSDDQRYCLKPAWAVDHAYAVLYSPTLREAKGVLQLKTLQRDFKDKINVQHTAYLVEFLQTRSLCRKLPNGGGYFFPDATSADELPEASELLANASSLIIRFELPYLPLGFHAGLVCRLFTPAGITTHDDIWRHGFILRKNTSRAVVHYLSRKSSVEMALVGEWQNFSALLNTLFVNMKAVLTEGKRGIREEQIHPSVVLDRHVFSVHSGERLVDVLGQINSYGQLIHEVKAMASKINVNVGDGSQVAIDAHNVTQKYNSDNVTITADQRQIISSVLDEMLRHKANLSDDVLEAVYDVRKAVKTDEKQPTEKSQSVLGKLWGGIRELTNVAKDMTDVGGFVVEHQAAIGTAVTAAAALLS